MVCSNSALPSLQRVEHRQHGEDGVFGPPGLRRRAQHQVLRRRRAERVQSGIHAFGIGLEHRAVRRKGPLERAMGHITKTMDARLLVDGQGARHRPAPTTRRPAAGAADPSGRSDPARGRSPARGPRLRATRRRWSARPARRDQRESAHASPARAASPLDTAAGWPASATWHTSRRPPMRTSITIRAAISRRSKRRTRRYYLSVG